MTTFVRMPARRRGILRRASIWDAGDYLLSVSGTTFFERYRRFYYRDIKAIVVQKGPRLGSIGAMLFTLWFSFPFFALWLSPGAPIVLRWIWVIPVLWLFWLIYVNLALSCRVFIYTAVSSEELPAIFRRRSAARAIPKILNKITQEQGEFPTLPDGVVRPVLPVAPRIEEASAAPVSRQILYSVGLFSTLFAVSAAFAFWYRDMAMTPSSLLFAKLTLPILNALEVATGVWALFKLARIRVMNSLRFMVFAGLGILAARSYSLLLVISLMNQQNGVLNDVLSNVHLRYWVGTADCALSMIVGLAGLISLILTWQDDRQVTQSSL